MDSASQAQKRIYKLVEEIASQKFLDERTFLQNLVQQVVDSPEFQIVGGRIWELMPNDKTYRLLFQYGNVNKIPNNYIMNIDEQPILKELHLEKTKLQEETDEILKESGIFIYSATGVGEIVRTKWGRFYEYVLGFNAPEILQSFYDTLSIISTIASSRLHDFRLIQSHEKIREDVARAAEIQRNLLPDHSINFSDFEIYGICVPDSDVGGDFFDYIPSLETEENRLAVVIGDASSKGLTAAIQALFVSGALSMAHKFTPQISSLMYHLNNLVYETFPLERFLTTFYCEISESSNRLVLYANAGHTEPLYYRRESEKFKLLPSTGGILGLVPNQKFNIENIRMKVGDILVLLTDGVLESQNEKDEFFGYDRLKGLIQKYRDYSSKEIAMHILEEVQTFSARSKFNDDRTLIIIKRTGTV
ncbi:MAG: PP2C family protein-serine/threonine phosphatase [Chloroherpetonaceae bacterium]|jgi:sigma-B regulation protein RsbU (phosphoserine phosphatase)|nr:serine/threonine-protein phosphatase [bacterium]